MNTNLREKMRINRPDDTVSRIEKTPAIIRVMLYSSSECKMRTASKGKTPDSIARVEFSVPYKNASILLDNVFEKGRRSGATIRICLA